MSETRILYLNSINRIITKDYKRIRGIINAGYTNAELLNLIPLLIWLEYISLADLN